MYTGSIGSISGLRDLWHTHIHRLIITADKGNGIVAGLSWDRLSMSVVIPDIVFNSPLLQSTIPRRVSEEIGPKNKEARPCICVCVFVSRVASSKCVSCISVENNSHLQPFSSPSTSKHSLKPLSLLLYVSLKCSSIHTVLFLLSSDHWICEVYSFIYSVFLISSFVYWASTGDRHSFASLWEDVLYRQKQQGNLYILQIFQMLTQFWSVLQRRASSCTTVIAALFSCLWSE